MCFSSDIVTSDTTIERKNKKKGQGIEKKYKSMLRFVFVNGVSKLTLIKVKNEKIFAGPLQ